MDGHGHGVETVDWLADRRKEIFLCRGNTFAVVGFRHLVAVVCALVPIPLWMVLVQEHVHPRSLDFRNQRKVPFSLPLE